MTPTRYKELGYTQHVSNLWRFIDRATGKAVGPSYKSKSELLTDLTRYATEFGCEKGRPMPELIVVPRRDYTEFINGALILFPDMERTIDHAQVKLPQATGCLFTSTSSTGSDLLCMSTMQWLYKGQVIAQAVYTKNGVTYYTRPMFAL